MSASGRGNVWHPDIDSDLQKKILNADWKDAPRINSDHSSDSIRIDEELKLLEKQKRDRSPDNNNREFWNLKKWREVLERYEQEHGVDSVNVPMGFCATANGVIMEYLGPNFDNASQLSQYRDNDNTEPEDTSWASLSNALSIGAFKKEENVRKLAENLGRYQHMKENEGMMHDDMDKRHIYVDMDDFEIAIIDVENSYKLNKDLSKFQGEKREMKQILDTIAQTKPNYEDTIYEGFQAGYDEIEEEPSWIDEREGFCPDKASDSLEQLGF